MKKFWIVCSLIFLFSKFTMGEGIFYFKSEAEFFNGYSKVFENIDLKFQAIVKKSTTTGIIRLYLISTLEKRVLTLEKRSISKILEYIKKFENWKQKTIDKEIVMTKKIGEICLPVYFKNHLSIWKKGSGVTIDFYFMSTLSPNQEILTSLILYIDKIECISNQFIYMDPIKILLFNKNIENFKKAFNQRFIDTEISKILTKRNKIEKEFK